MSFKSNAAITDASDGTEDRNLKILDGVIHASLIGFLVFSFFSISITQGILFVGTMAWVMKVLWTRSFRQLRFPLWLPIVIFCSVSLLAVAAAVDPLYSVPSLKKLLQFVIIFWVANVVESDRQRDRLILVFISAASLAAIYGIYQASVAGVALNSRVAGTLSTYMTFAGVLMLAALLGLSRLLLRQPREKWLAVPVLLIFFCLLLTLTRQAWLGFAVGTFFLFAVWKRKLLWLVPVFFAAVLLFSPLQVRERMQSMLNLEDVTFQERLELWRGGWRVFKDHPITGCGFRCLNLVHSQYPDPTGVIKKFRGMHSNIIQIMVDTGILGLVSWLAIWISFFIHLYRQKKLSTHDSSEGWLTKGSAAVVLGFLAGGIFEVNFYDSEVVMLVYFVMALPFTARGGKLMERSS